MSWLRLAALFLLALLCGVARAEEPTVRVALLQEAESIRLTVPAPCRLTDLETGRLLAEWPSLSWQEVRPSNPGLRMGVEPIPSQAVVLTPLGNEIFRVNSRPYRGALILRRTENGRLLVVNRLGLEEYLVGALTSETSPKWPMEALKAHAVVSRTMVAHRIWIRKGESFDVTADTSTHLYAGAGAERRRTRDAVEETSGQVLAHEGELFSATFNANCGGHTEAASEIWQTKQEIPPLQGRPDPFCKNLRHYRWKSVLAGSELVHALGQEAQGIGHLAGCQVLDRNRSGRVRKIRLEGDRGAVVLTGRRFRELLGANRLRSLNFTAAVSDDRVLLEGFGWGHGVGLCQWGAYGMARRAKKAEEILEFYFPGARRRTLKGLPGFS